MTLARSADNYTNGGLGGMIQGCLFHRNLGEGIDRDRKCLVILCNVKSNISLERLPQSQNIES